MGAIKGREIDKIKDYGLERERKREGWGRERDIKTGEEREGMGAIKGSEIDKNKDYGLDRERKRGVGGQRGRGNGQDQSIRKGEKEGGIRI